MAILTIFGTMRDSPFPYLVLTVLRVIIKHSGTRTTAMQCTHENIPGCHINVIMGISIEYVIVNRNITSSNIQRNTRDFIFYFQLPVPYIWDPIWHHCVCRYHSWRCCAINRQNADANFQVSLPFNGSLTTYVKCRYCTRRECRERFSRHWLQRKPLVSVPGMHHSTCVTHVP